MEEYKIVLAIDSFKGSGTTFEVEGWVAEGIQRTLKNSNILQIPIADGGEGTVKSLTTALDGTFVTTTVFNSIGEEVEAEYGLLDSETAIIEMAEASGMGLVENNLENVLKGNTYGVGQLIVHAIEKGVKKIYIGLGGSATNDGGMGMAQALGYQFIDKNGNIIDHKQTGASSLKEVAKIDASKRLEALDDVTIMILSDVSNPLVGKNGATAIYGPQKGVPKDRIEEIDSWMKQYADVIDAYTGKQISEIPGSGAAGGLGAGLLAFCHTEIYQGIDKMLEIINFEDTIKDAHLVITGEGSIDDQSIQGKAPIGIAKIAKKLNVPVMAIVGSRENDLTKVYDAGLDLVLSVINRPMTLEEAIENTEDNIITAGETAIRAFLLGKKR
ncbi:glycerate kinase [Fundicoccus culcitae]|uniref:Glycerate kinase n=1 Tax=Fundicoccus culcitae TaxID=2969821 RepID=A0ABY5P8T1_9LACT|nr:glycerate kinase [Fundicoccus culcitae]UUX34768.1 glycerate kinase [Fundicoccus culcitae]